MLKIYLSSTLKHQWNLDLNPKLAAALEAAGFKVYLPQRDTNQQGDLDTIFEEDLKGMKDCQILLAVIKNASPNLWAELGWTYGQSKKIIILADQLDFIPAFPQKMATEIIKVENLENIENYLDKLIKSCLK